MNKHERGTTKITALFLVLILIIAVFLFWRLQSDQRGNASNTVVSESTGENESAKVLAKKNSTFSEFNQNDYEKALSEGKIIYLEFYANWCPICRAQETDLIEGFEQLSRADIAGFRVNFKDDQTDEDEKSLAKKYKIPYQHHKIVLKNKGVVIDSAATWDAQTLVSELSKL